jgi:hypothetical protein
MRKIKPLECEIEGKTEQESCQQKKQKLLKRKPLDVKGTCVLFLIDLVVANQAQRVELLGLWLFVAFPPHRHG